MKLQFSATIKHCSQAQILDELERQLRTEAWEIWRKDDGLVALGIGVSARVINVSDQSSFLLSSSADSVTVRVLVDFHAAGSSSSESQALKVRQRHEAILTEVCEHLQVRWSHEESSVADNKPQLKATQPSIESDRGPLPRVSEEVRPADPAATVPVVSANDSSSRPPMRYGRMFISGVAIQFSKPLVWSGVFLLLIVVFIYFSISRWDHRSLSLPHASTPIVKPREPREPDSAGANSQGKAADKEASGLTNAPSTLRHPDDVMLWLADWAAAERAKDAGVQMAFYADNVRPYLDHASYDRAALLREKQDAIRRRKGLWTFGVEGISIHRQGKNVVLVDLTKHLMTQTRGVVVSEQWIPSRLVLVRTHGNWMISAEQDFQPRAR